MLVPLHTLRVITLTSVLTFGERYAEKHERLMFLFNKRFRYLKGFALSCTDRPVAGRRISVNAKSLIRVTMNEYRRFLDLRLKIFEMIFVNIVPVNVR